jgi:phosphoribosylformylglycinamidine synthase
MFLAKVYISLKPSVNDPQGLAIRSGLHQLGFDSALDVRAGKYIEIRVDEGEESVARERVSEMCRQLLANPIIEDFRFDLEAENSPTR